MTTSAFWENFELPAFGPLEHALDVDMVVVGGGITGVTCSRILGGAGIRVALLERDRCGQKNNAGATAHLTFVSDLRISQLVRSHGMENARSIWNAGLTALRQIEEIVANDRIDCDFTTVPGYLTARIGAEEDETAELEAEARLVAELGFSSYFLPRCPLIERPGICFPNQATIHPLKYVAGLLRAIRDQGGLVFEETGVDEVGDGENGIQVSANGQTVSCRCVLIATDVTLKGMSSLIGATLPQTMLAPCTSHVVGARVPRGKVSPALFWDTSTPCFHLRAQAGADDDYLMLGGRDQKTGQAEVQDSPFDGLDVMLRSLVPEAVIQHHWSGQVTESHDGLPLIGEMSPGQFVATGFSGNGITFATLAGMMIADQILGRANPWTPLFTPGRGPGKGGIYNYLTENLQYPYYLLKDGPTGGEHRAADSVAPGKGQILILNGQRVAVSRDQGGALHTVSAVCTHLGCIVTWNDVEQSWDCPCHGSRFARDGRVLAGPAEAPLPPVDLASGDCG